MADAQPTSIAETWKPVVGFEECYEVSDHGRIRSLSRTVRGRNRNGPMLKAVRGQMLKFHTDPDGYWKVCLSRGGARKYPSVHKVVLEAFAGPAPSGRQARHLDGNKDNNAASNLAWGTALENSADRRKHGVDLCGQAHPNARLTEGQAKEILAEHQAGVANTALAKRYGVSVATVQSLVCGRTWAHLHSGTTKHEDRRAWARKHRKALKALKKAKKGRGK